MPKRTGDFDAWLLGELTDPQTAANYINAAISEDPDLLPVVLREVAKAYTMKKVAKDAGVARESLYTILSGDGNPTLINLNAVLRAVKLKIAIVSESSSTRQQESDEEIAPALQSPADDYGTKPLQRTLKDTGITTGIHYTQTTHFEGPAIEVQDLRTKGYLLQGGYVSNDFAQATFGNPFENASHEGEEFIQEASLTDVQIDKYNSLISQANAGRMSIPL